jgi:hypothetical protein
MEVVEVDGFVGRHAMKYFQLKSTALTIPRTSPTLASEPLKLKNPPPALGASKKEIFQEPL